MIGAVGSLAESVGLLHRELPGSTDRSIRRTPLGILNPRVHSPARRSTPGHRGLPEIPEVVVLENVVDASVCAVRFHDASGDPAARGVGVRGERAGANDLRLTRRVVFLNGGFG